MANSKKTETTRDKKAADFKNDKTLLRSPGDEGDENFPDEAA